MTNPSTPAMNLEAHNRYVAHVDMLGMSKLTLANPTFAWAALSRFAQARDEILGLRLEIVDSGQMIPIRDRVADLTFSDTLLMFTKSDEVADLCATFHACEEFVCRSMSYCVPVRAGLAHGPFLFNMDHHVFAGPPLVSAHQLGEAAQWLGVVLDDVVAERAAKVPFKSARGRPVVVQWNVPVKPSGVRRCNVVDWPESHRNNFTVPLPLSAADFYKPFEQLSGAWDTLPAEVRAKYVNTVSFINGRLCGTV